MRRYTAVLGVTAFLSAGCVRPSPRMIATPAVSGDSLGELLVDRMDLRPRSLELLLGQRITVEFTRVPWADSSDAIRFDRAYDVAHLLWSSYGAAHAIDTIMVRHITPGPASADAQPVRIEEFSFYPEQLSARKRPRLGPVR